VQDAYLRTTFQKRNGVEAARTLTPPTPRGSTSPSRTACVRPGMASVAGPERCVNVTKKWFERYGLRTVDGTRIAARLRPRCHIFYAGGVVCMVVRDENGSESYAKLLEVFDGRLRVARIYKNCCPTVTDAPDVIVAERMDGPDLQRRAGGHFSDSSAAC
jgi:hypothetical protein